MLRISGDLALATGNAAWKGSQRLSRSRARMLSFGHCGQANGSGGDPALAVFMPSPNSYTGEDVVEIHCHGGGLVSRNLLESILGSGARLAEPGEFTFRAFMNGKLDLTQAEAVGDIISAQSELALKLAENQIAGRLGGKIREARIALLDVLSEIESRMDFGEEELDWKKPADLVKTIQTASLRISQLLESRAEGAVLRSGARMVIAGRPNAGKSSLFNTLIGFDRAIVTELPGTTRDTLEEHVVLRGIPFRIIDTAGIRQADNIIEGMGVQRSLASLGQAQVILWLMDATSEDSELERLTMMEHTGGKKGVVPAWNKCDLLPHGEKLPTPSAGTHQAIRISTLTGDGIEQLLDAVEQQIWQGSHHGDPDAAVSARHAELLDEASAHLNGTEDRILAGELELASVGIRAAIISLGRITGEDADPDILDNIFSRFCIGK